MPSFCCNLIIMTLHVATASLSSYPNNIKINDIQHIFNNLSDLHYNAYYPQTASLIFFYLWLFRFLCSSIANYIATYAYIFVTHCPPCSDYNKSQSE